MHQQNGPSSVPWCTPLSIYFSVMWNWLCLPWIAVKKGQKCGKKEQVVVLQKSENHDTKNVDTVANSTNNTILTVLRIITFHLYWLLFPRVLPLSGKSCHWMVVGLSLGTSLIFNWHTLKANNFSSCCWYLNPTWLDHIAVSLKVCQLRIHVANIRSFLLATFRFEKT